MNREFVTLSDEQLEMVTGGGDTTQTATALAYSEQAAANVTSDVVYAKINNKITLNAFNTAVATNIANSFK